MRLYVIADRRVNWTFVYLPGIAYRGTFDALTATASHHAHHEATGIAHQLPPHRFDIGFESFSHPNGPSRNGAFLALTGNSRADRTLRSRIAGVLRLVRIGWHHLRDLVPDIRLGGAIRDAQFVALVVRSLQHVIGHGVLMASA